MKKFILLIIIVGITLSTSAQKVSIDFFYTENCKKCEEIKNLILPQLADECQEQYEINSYGFF